MGNPGLVKCEREQAVAVTPTGGQALATKVNRLLIARAFIVRQADDLFQIVCCALYPAFVIIATADLRGAGDAAISAIMCRLRTRCTPVS